MVVRTKTRPVEDRKPVRFFAHMVQFYRDTRGELRRVVWPTRQQAINLTIVVIAVSAAVGAFLGIVDFILKRIFELVLGGG